MFHFCQAIWKKAKSMKEIAAKVDDKSSHINSIVRMYTRLSFLPVEKITAGIDSISQYQKIHHLEKDFEEFNKYITTTWMKVYKASEWCVSDETQRTNNNVEAYNNKIKGLISRNRNVYVFLDGFLNSQNSPEFFRIPYNSSELFTILKNSWELESVLNFFQQIPQNS
jgi:hypothetical protein